MKVFVVIVSYNGAKWTQKCFDSIRNNSVPLTTIVIDNGSTDGTQSLIQTKYPEVDLIRSPANLGFGAANNLGIKKAYDQGADYVFLLNQDAWIQQNTIKELIEVAENNPEYYVISPLHLNGKGDALDYNFSVCLAPPRCNNIYSDLVVKTKTRAVYELPFVNAAAWLITRKCMQMIGGFNPSFFHYGEDDNYCSRIIYHGGKIGVVPGVSIYHDREERKNNEYFDNNKKVIQRKFIMDMSDPNHESTPFRLYMNLYKRLLRSFIMLRFDMFQKTIISIRVLNKLDKNRITKNKLKSKEKGNHFF